QRRLRCAETVASRTDVDRGPGELSGDVVGRGAGRYGWTVGRSRLKALAGSDRAQHRQLIELGVERHSRRLDLRDGLESAVNALEGVIAIVFGDRLAGLVRQGEHLYAR